MKLLIIILIGTMGLCTACNGSQKRITLPAFCSIDKNEKVNDYKKIMIVYYRGTCASCFLNKSRQWHSFIKYAEVDNHFRFVMLLPEKDSINVNNFTTFNSPEFPVLCDQNSLFFNHNKKYLNGNVCVFLLNEKGEILLKGNPTYNKKLWDRYLELVINLQ